MLPLVFEKPEQQAGLMAGLGGVMEEGRFACNAIGFAVGGKSDG